MDDVAPDRKSKAGPLLEPTVACFGVVARTGAVVLSADDQVREALGSRRKAHVVVGVARIPIEGVRQGSLRKTQGQRIRSVGRLLRMQGVAKVNGAVGRDGDGARPHLETIARFDLCHLTTGNAGDAGARVDQSARALDGSGKTREVPKWMNASLTGKKEARTRIERIERHARQALDSWESDASGRVELCVEELLVLRRPEEEISVHALEIAVDGLARDDGFDLVD